MHWVIAGAESGPGARPIDEDLVRALRDQRLGCAAFFCKQRVEGRQMVSLPALDGVQHAEFPSGFRCIEANEGDLIDDKLGGQSMALDSGGSVGTYTCTDNDHPGGPSSR